MAVTSFTTLARVKTALETGGADPVDPSHESYLNQLIVDYSSQFEVYLGRKSTVATYRKQFDVDAGQRVIVLDAYPVTSVATVSNASDRDFSISTISAADRYTDTVNGLITVDKVALIPGPGVVMVNWVGGLGTNTTALVRDFPDMAHAADIQIDHHFRRRESMAATGISQGAGNRSWEGAMTFLPTVVDILNRRRRVYF